ncbi:UNVERIFIED_ORG: hypothetical protein FHR35_003283 [Microbispora rosea subsp. rosea]
MEAAAAERLQERDFGLWADKRSLRLAEQLETCLVVRVLGIADSEKDPGIPRSTSAAHLRAQNLLMTFGEVRLSLKRREERKVTLRRGRLVQTAACSTVSMWPHHPGDDCVSQQAVRKIREATMETDDLARFDEFVRAVREGRELNPSELHQAGRLLREMIEAAVTVAAHVRTEVKALPTRYVLCDKTGDPDPGARLAEVLHRTQLIEDLLRKAQFQAGRSHATLGRIGVQTNPDVNESPAIP